MTELLVGPYTHSDFNRADDLYVLLTTHPQVAWVSADLDICDLAASFRARHRMQTPDAVRAATGVRSQATAFITNDPVFKRVDAFETVVLDTLL